MQLEKQDAEDVTEEDEVDLKGHTKCGLVEPQQAVKARP